MGPFVILRAKQSEFPYPTGTQITLSGFEKHWWKDIQLHSLAREIEQHFER